MRRLLYERNPVYALADVTVESRQLSPETSSAELKQLAREVRSATERVTALSAEIDAAVAAANSTMKDARERVIARFSGIGAPQASRVAGPPVPALLTHWVERLREMVQDAARKGERMAESQERVSSAAQRVSRRIEEEAHDIEGLVARLTPMGATSEVPPAAPTRDRSDGDPAPSRTLRLLDPESRGPARTDDSTAEEEGGS